MRISFSQDENSTEVMTMRTFAFFLLFSALLGAAQAQTTSGTLTFFSTDLKLVRIEKSPVKHRELNVMFADIDSKIGKDIRHFPAHAESEFLDILSSGGAIITDNDKYTMKCLVLGTSTSEINKAFEALKTSILYVRGQTFSTVMRIMGFTQIDFRVGMFVDMYHSTYKIDGTRITRDDIPTEMTEEINSAMIDKANDLYDLQNKSADSNTNSYARTKVINDYVLAHNRKNPGNTIMACDLSEEMKKKIVDAAVQGNPKPAFEKK
jgi:hypothetical protein